MSKYLVTRTLDEHRWETDENVSQSDYDFKLKPTNVIVEFEGELPTESEINALKRETKVSNFSPEFKHDYRYTILMMQKLAD